MCGIVGYTGERQALGVLLEGLARLEYRGYDSTGICLAGRSGLQPVRAADNLAALRHVVAASDIAPASSGIGHTRWATHGEVSIANTHPFLGCATGTFAIALNGIIENFESLREELATAGHCFESTTDAEVVVHLMEDHAALDIVDALAVVAAQLEGHFGIVAVDSRRPGVVVGTRRGVPLVVGLGEGEQFLGSSIDALLTNTQRFLLLEDDDIVELHGTSYVLRRPNGQPVARIETIVDRPASEANHEGFGSFVAKEISEQPRAIADTLRGRIDGPRVRLHELQGGADGAFDARSIDRLVITGCGSALHAGHVARAMFESWARLHTEVAVASEWRHADPMVDERTLVIGVSQSGETADTLEAIRLARELGAQTLGITNMADSQLTREVDRHVLTHAGVEMSVAATKTFTAQVAMFALLAFEFGTARGTLSDEEAEQVLIELELIPEKMACLLSRPHQMERIAETIADAPFVVYLGRRSGMAVALEGALKLREIAYVPAEVHPAGELKHGSIALMERGTPVIAIVTDDTEPDRTLSSIHEVRARGAHVIAIATEGNRQIAGFADEVIWVPATHPKLEALLSVLPLQYLAHDVARARGHNVDQPRNLAKTVTVS